MNIYYDEMWNEPKLMVEKYIVVNIINITQNVCYA